MYVKMYERCTESAKKDERKKNERIKENIAECSDGTKTKKSSEVKRNRRIFINS